MRTTPASPRRHGAVSAGRPGQDLTEGQRRRLPPGFEAVGEALASGASPEAACAEVGRSLARDGASLGEALSALRQTYAVVGDEAPDFSVVEALGVAWGEATLEFLHDLSCEDPLTGLASAAHLRARVAEVYREAERSGSSVREGFALVVVDIARCRGPERSRDPLEAVFGRALRVAAAADAARTVFWGGATVGRVGPGRVVVLARRTPDLAAEVAALRDTCAGRGLAGARVWSEGLPVRPESAVLQLSELARGG